MDIPSNLVETECYYDRVLSLLEKWTWLYQDRATQILLCETLSFPYLDSLENIDNHSLNQLPLEECARLTFKIPVSKIQPADTAIPKKLRKCTSKKKQHEVNRLAPYILEQCLQSKITRIYDIGSGLGYIDRLLTTIGGLSVVGVELDSDKIERAVKLNKEILEPHLSINITYIPYRLEDSNLEHLCKQLECYQENGGLVGLHACGDLSAVTLRLFLRMKNLKCLILMACCYHKMINRNSFPLNTVLKKKLSAKKRTIINNNLLRLASECTRERWCNETEDLHMAHAFHVLARATVERFLSDYKYKAERKGRKCVVKQDSLSWDDYVISWVYRHRVTNEDGTLITSTVVHSQLISYWSKYGHLAKRIVAYTCLQMCLQGVAESLLLIDKLSFLAESGQTSATAIRITNPAISPRSVAIIAKKL